MPSDDNPDVDIVHAAAVTVSLADLYRRIVRVEPTPANLQGEIAALAAIVYRETHGPRGDDRKAQQAPSKFPPPLDLDARIPAELDYSHRPPPTPPRDPNQKLWQAIDDLQLAQDHMCSERGLGYASDLVRAVEESLLELASRPPAIADPTQDLHRAIKWLIVMRNSRDANDYHCQRDGWAVDIVAEWLASNQALPARNEPTGETLFEREGTANPTT